MYSLAATFPILNHLCMLLDRLYNIYRHRLIENMLHLDDLHTMRK